MWGYKARNGRKDATAESRMISGHGFLTVLSVILLAFTPQSTLGCGSVEEGTQTDLRCETSDAQDFQTFGVRSTSDSGVFRYLSICNKNGSCTDNEPDHYNAKLTKTFDESTGSFVYTLRLIMYSVSRDDSQLHCVTDGISQAQCELDVYVKPEKPVCARPKFIQNGAVIFLECKADRIYPNALCSFYKSDSEKVDSSLVHSFHQPSARYPRNKQVTCELRMPVRHLQEGDYHLLAAVQPSVPERSDDDLVYADSPSSVKLSTVGFSYPPGEGTSFKVEAGTNLGTVLDITGNPPPNRFSVKLQPISDYKILTVPHGYYDVSYSNGKLTLLLKDVGKSGPGFGNFTFRASNGINGTSPELKYTFKVSEKDDSKEENSIIVAIVFFSIVVFFLIFVGVCICRKDRRETRQMRATMNNQCRDVSYIYPNMGFQSEPPDYSNSVSPPPYEGRGNIYDQPNECMELDSNPQAAGRELQEAARGSTGTVSENLKY
ncbi:hypothetical protein PoB_006346000 [Plakobranchus ocellatus]|uniref:Uncharacterized protein n=1 Tax=Plakobranchus ocellatus TaxID=259542 RepID=A0AAV4CYJ5_9GAST|nr:hypothetical protein PoB_006346000 [Plakobranchus ocellatus]